MNLGPTSQETLARARTDIRMGVPIVLCSPKNAAVTVPVETLTSERLEQLRKLGMISLALTSRRAETLKARAYDGDIARIAIPNDTGIDWVSNMADPTDDLRMPMKGPYKEIRGGDASLARASVLLAKDAHLIPATVLVSISDPHKCAEINNLTIVELADIETLQEAADILTEVVSANVPLTVSENVRLHVFRPKSGGEEHFAIEIGRPDRNKPVLARLHSACFTGDLLGSLKCDCGPQLRAALKQMGDKGAGILLYLNQEGRGIGIANKMRAYSLQDQGFDTVEANHRLGFEDDERDFRLGSSVLKELGFSAVRLMTNNPAKVAIMEANGIEVVERVPLRVGENKLNTNYLATKAKKSGHLL